MNVLVTGAKGFIGKNFCAQLENIKAGKCVREGLVIDEIYRYDIDSTAEQLQDWCGRCDIVFNFAGINRPVNQDEFMKGNRDFADNLLAFLEKAGNRCPVMLSSSQQASLQGRWGDSEYGRSKKAGEQVFFDYSQKTGAKVLVYRFPNVFGKWSRPNYNSAVATFCHNLSRDMEIKVNDPSVEMELVYIDDVVEEMLCAIQGKEHRSAEDPRFCRVPVTHFTTLGHIVDTLKSFVDQRVTLDMPQIPQGSLESKLFSTYLSFLPADKVCCDLKMNVDERGSFTELLHTLSAGQVSVNVSRPGITKGEHWHNSKWEIFIVVSGRALIRERKIDSDEIVEFEVDGKKIQAVYMLPGYTHNIINLSDSEDLVTVMWANEKFDPSRPDTYREKV